MRAQISRFGKEQLQHPGRRRSARAALLLACYAPALSAQVPAYRGYVRYPMALRSSQISRVNDALARSVNLDSTANW